MKPEQRLLLALTLTLAILMAWSALAPTPPPKSTGPGIQSFSEIKREILSQVQTPPAEKGQAPQSFLLGDLHLEVGKEGGGVKSLRLPEANLLVDSNPGFFQIQPEQPSQQPLWLETRREEKILRSEGNVDGLSITRSIKEEGNLNCKFLYKIELQISNETQERRKAQFQVVVYRPFYIEKELDRRYREGFVFVDGKRVRIQVKEGSRRDFTGSPLWIAAQGKSHLLIVKPLSPVGMFHVEHVAGGPVGWLTLPEVELGPKEKSRSEFLLYAGPIRLSDLKAADLEGAVTFGAFSVIAKLLLGIMNWNERWLHNYGLAILFLSFGIWLVFFPMTWSGIRMMRVMAELQPQVERIRKEHEKNPEKMNRELLELYRKHRVNPLGGCLPLLFQMPIFIALYQVLTRSAELTGAHFLWIKDLSAPDAVLHFPSEIPFLGRSLNLLPLLMAVAMFLQQRMMKSSQAALTEEQQVQQKVFQFFPLFFGFLFYGLPSGLVLYWLTNTLFSIGQQLILARAHKPTN